MIITNTKPSIPSGWTIEYHNYIQEVNLDDLVLHLEPEQKSGYLDGTILNERLKATAMNASLLDYFLEHTDKIPASWKGKYIYFHGTIYRSAVGNLVVRYLYWHVGRWCSRGGGLSRDWGEASPALCTKLSQPSDTSTLDLRLSALERFVEKKFNVKL